MFDFSLKLFIINKNRLKPEQLKPKAIIKLPFAKFLNVKHLTVSWFLYFRDVFLTKLYDFLNKIKASFWKKSIISATYNDKSY